MRLRKGGGREAARPQGLRLTRPSLCAGCWLSLSQHLRAPPLVSETELWPSAHLTDTQLEALSGRSTDSTPGPPPRAVLEEWQEVPRGPPTPHVPGKRCWAAVREHRQPGGDTSFPLPKLPGAPAPISQPLLPAFTANAWSQACTVL